MPPRLPDATALLPSELGPDAIGVNERLGEPLVAGFAASRRIRQERKKFQDSCRCTQAIERARGELHRELRRVLVIDARLAWNGLGNSLGRWVNLLRIGQGMGFATFLWLSDSEQVHFDLGDFFTSTTTEWQWNTRTAAAVADAMAKRGVHQPTRLHLSCRRATFACMLYSLYTEGAETRGGGGGGGTTTTCTYEQEQQGLLMRQIAGGGSSWLLLSLSAQEMLQARSRWQLAAGRLAAGWWLVAGGRCAGVASTSSGAVSACSGRGVCKLCIASHACQRYGPSAPAGVLESSRQCAAARLLPIAAGRAGATRRGARELCDVRAAPPTAMAAAPDGAPSRRTRSARRADGGAPAHRAGGLAALRGDEPRGQQLVE